MPARQPPLTGAACYSANDMSTMEEAPSYKCLLSPLLPQLLQADCRVPFPQSGGGRARRWVPASGQQNVSSRHRGGGALTATQIHCALQFMGRPSQARDCCDRATTSKDQDAPRAAAWIDRVSRRLLRHSTGDLDSEVKSLPFIPHPCSVYFHAVCSYFATVREG